MTDAQANKALLQKAYNRWHDSRGGSVDDWMGIVAENIRFGSLAEGAPPMEFTAEISGREKMSNYFNGLLEGWEMEHYTIDVIVAEGDRAVAIGSTAWRNKQTGKLLDTRKVDVWRFADGKAVEFYEYFDTAKAFEAAS